MIHTPDADTHGIVQKLDALNDTSIIRHSEAGVQAVSLPLVRVFAVCLLAG